MLLKSKYNKILYTFNQYKLKSICFASKKIEIIEILKYYHNKNKNCNK